MVTTYNRRGPSTPLVIAIAMAIVLGCFLLWVGSLEWFQDQEGRNNGTQAAQNEEDDNSNFPTFSLGPSPTPVPECMMFEVNVESAIMRKCPDQSCEIRETVPFNREVCVYGKAQSTEYLSADEWYVVDINANGAFRDLVYMHESVLKPLNPTPRPTRTFTPLPTVTHTPTFTREPLFTVTPAPLETELPTATPTPAESPTLPRQNF